jgi:hypothetical protein
VRWRRKVQPVKIEPLRPEFHPRFEGDKKLAEAALKILELRLRKLERRVEQSR